MVYTCKWFKQENYNYLVDNHAFDCGWCCPNAYAFRGMCLSHKFLQARHGIVPNVSLIISCDQ